MTNGERPYFLASVTGSPGVSDTLAESTPLVAISCLFLSFHYISLSPPFAGSAPGHPPIVVMAALQVTLGPYLLGLISSHMN
jgi:hypothetical protein